MQPTKPTVMPFVVAWNCSLPRHFPSAVSFGASTSRSGLAPLVALDALAVFSTSPPTVDDDPERLKGTYCSPSFAFASISIC